MAAPPCSPPAGQEVRSHWRGRVRRKAKPRPGAYPWVVMDERSGRVVTRHRTFTAAVRQRKRMDLATFRQGKGRPFHVEKAKVVVNVV